MNRLSVWGRKMEGKRGESLFAFPSPQFPAPPKACSQASREDDFPSDARAFSVTSFVKRKALYCYLKRFLGFLTFSKMPQDLNN